MPPTITFRCPPEWADILPRPIPAGKGLPDWLKNMPANAKSALIGEEVRTVKQCPPFLDAMGSGWLMPLMADIKVEGGHFSWDWELPPTRFEQLHRSPLGLHVSAQASGSPLAQDGEAYLKFSNFWTVEAPEGFSILFSHPANRPDLPFQTLSGLVDADHFTHGLTHFPAVWKDRDFSGSLPKGTPVAQIWLVPRAMEAAYGTLSDADASRFEETLETLSSAPGGYRKKFRAKKR